MKRSSAVLLPIFSLPSKYGIGTLGKEAYKFIDFLVDTKQTYWQILPIMETSFGNSPYSSTSSFAGNPYFIDLDMLKDDGLIKESDYISVDFGNDNRRVDYYKLYINRFNVLKIACDNYRKKHPIAYVKFKYEYNFFLESYAVFHAIKDVNNGAPFSAWSSELRDRDADSLNAFKKEHENEIEFYKTVQCLFYDQWFKLKKYANSKGIKIIGDVPIYSAYDSAEVWAGPLNFYLDNNKVPVEISGCPPDGFSPKGQLWGNPLYNYEYIKENDYKYFIDKFAFLNKIYDVIRIDHFRGFDSYYAIRLGCEDAIHGMWKEGPGIELFNKINKELGHVEIIVEDLGFLTDSVRKLLKDTGYPGMKVLQFAFDSRDKNNSEYLPHTYPENSTAYIGTHDNDTFIGWYNSINQDDKNYAKEYLHLQDDPYDAHRALTVLYESKSNLAVATMQDLLMIGSEGRINVPSTISDMNWSFRFTEDQFDESVKIFLRDLTIKTGRQ